MRSNFGIKASGLYIPPVTLTLVGTPEVQQVASSAGSKTLTYTSDCGAGELILVTADQNCSTVFPTSGTPTVPTGSGIVWVSVGSAQGAAGHFTKVSAWYGITTGAFTASFTQTTTVSGGGCSVRGTLRRFTGFNATTPVGTSTAVGTFQGQTDPVLTAANLVSAGVAVGDILIMLGGDWNAGTTVTTAIAYALAGTPTVFDQSVSKTDRINSNESGQMHYIDTDTTNVPVAGTYRGQMDVTGATGDWSGMIFPVRAA